MTNTQLVEMFNDMGAPQGVHLTEDDFEMRIPEDLFDYETGDYHLGRCVRYLLDTLAMEVVSVRVQEACDYCEAALGM